MSAREKILNSLQHASAPLNPKPIIDITTENEDLITVYGNSLAMVAGTLYKERDLTAVNNHASELINHSKQVLSAVNGVKGNVPLTATPQQLSKLDYAILPGELAVAENGAVWVNESIPNRITPFICEHLLLVVSQDTLVANMHLAMKKITLSPGGFGAFIAGPSKTSDIEQSLVVGAHGAASVGVYLVNSTMLT